MVLGRLDLVLFIVLLFLNTSAVSSKRLRDEHCPTWFVPGNITNGTVNCKCRDSPQKLVLCEQHSNTSLLYLGACMTYSETDNVTMVGGCPYNSHRAEYHQVYVNLPQDPYELNGFMCSGMNRSGLLCSECEPNTGPAVFSYTHQCLECMDPMYGWPLYIFLATFPTTILFLVVIICQIRVIASAPMNSFIFISQVITTAVNLIPSLYMSSSAQGLPVMALTLYGIWNLDFFRYVIPPFCVNTNLRSIHVAVLEYIVAFYPLLLIVATFVCIESHDRGCRVLVCLWKPFHKCLAMMRKRWDSTSSLIHAFAAFLILSYSKLFFVSFSLLNVTSMYNNRGIRVGHVVFYDASLTYFGIQHLPFAVLAIVVLAVFVILPVLILLLYPTRVFQNILSYCRIRWHGLHAFADVFQHCYKDGTSGTWDYRYFAGLYFLLRLMMYIGYANMALVVLPITASLAFALIRPYKNNWFNILDSLTFALLAFCILAIVYNVYVSKIPLELVYAISVLPLLYITLYSSYQFMLWISLTYHCPKIHKLLTLLQNANAKASPMQPSSKCDIDDLPDRIINPEQYEPLLATADGRRDKELARGMDHETSTLPACGNSWQDYGSI